MTLQETVRPKLKRLGIVLRRVELLHFCIFYDRLRFNPEKTLHLVSRAGLVGNY